MFQNMADSAMQNENERIKKDDKLFLVLKELFKPQNVTVYVLTFLVSMIDFNGAYIPLGLAMVAGSLRKYNSYYYCIYL